MIIDPNNPNGDSPGELPAFNPHRPGDGELMGFRIVTKEWRSVKAIFAETGQPVSILLRALKDGHGIEITDTPNPEGLSNPFLHFIVSEEQTALMRKHGIQNPTFLQLLGTSEVISLSQDDAVRRFRAMKGDPRA